MYLNKVQILSENVDEQSQNTPLEVDIFASKSQRLKVGLGLFRISSHCRNLIKQRDLH